MQLRARLAVVTTARATLKTTSGKRPVAPAGVTATTVVARTAAQRQVANEAIQKSESKKFVELVQSKDIPHELGDVGIDLFFF